MIVHHFKTSTLALNAISTLLATRSMAAPKWDAITLNYQGMFYIDPNSVTQASGRKVSWSAIN